MSSEFAPQSNSLAHLMSLSALVDEAIAENGGELTPEIEEMLDLTQGLQERKVDQYDFVIKHLEAEAAFLANRAKEINLASKARAVAAEQVRGRIKDLMLAHGKTEIQGEYVRFRISPTLPKLVIESEEKLPPEYTKTEITVDKTKIKQDLMGGTPVQGARLEESFSLRAYPASGMKQVGGR